MKTPEINTNQQANDEAKRGSRFAAVNLLAEMNRHIERLITMKAENEFIRCAVNDRHAYATHTLDEGSNIRSAQEALGHASLETTPNIWRKCWTRWRG